jgi:hypothetical protein
VRGAEFVGDELQISDAPTGGRGNPKIASRADAGFVVVWRGTEPVSGRFDVIGRRFDPEGTPIGTEFGLCLATRCTRVCGAAWTGGSGLILGRRFTLQGGNRTPTNTPRPTSTPVRTCVGDCNADLRVDPVEMIVGVRIALGTDPTSRCVAFDSNADETVGITELTTAVAAALRACR